MMLLTSNGGATVKGGRSGEDRARGRCPSARGGPGGGGGGAARRVWWGATRSVTASRGMAVRRAKHQEVVFMASRHHSGSRSGAPPSQKRLPLFTAGGRASRGIAELRCPAESGDTSCRERG